MQTADVFKIAEHITTPLMLAALVVLVIFASLRTKISEPRARQLFILALVAIVLGIAADMTGKVLRPPFLHGRVYSPPNDITQGIGHADVILRYNSGGEDAVCSDPKGEFQFAIPPGSWAGVQRYGRLQQVSAFGRTYQVGHDADVYFSAAPGWAQLAQPPDSSPPAAISGEQHPRHNQRHRSRWRASREATCLNDLEEYLSGRNQAARRSQWTAAAKIVSSSCGKTTSFR
jgi:hypothetical protein